MIPTLLAGSCSGGVICRRDETRCFLAVAGISLSLELSMALALSLASRLPRPSETRPRRHCCRRRLATLSEHQRALYFFPKHDFH